MKNMQERWNEYLTTVYPQGVKQSVEKHVHQAYLAGALSLGAAICEACNGDMEKAQEEVKELVEEITDMTKDHLHAHLRDVENN